MSEIGRKNVISFPDRSALARKHEQLSERRKYFSDRIYDKLVQVFTDLKHEDFSHAEIDDLFIKAIEDFEKDYLLPPIPAND